LKFGSNRKIRLCATAALALLILGSIFAIPVLVIGICCPGGILPLGLIVRVFAYTCLIIIAFRLKYTKDIITTDLSEIAKYTSFDSNCGD
jgi:hypothetical protein